MAQALRAGRLATIPLAGLLVACGGGAPAAVPRSGGAPHRAVLANGLTVLVRPDHRHPRVAVEIIYRAGIAHEPEGKPHVAHLAEHLAVKGATKSFPALGSYTWLQGRGLANAETLLSLVHFDAVVAPPDVEEVLRIEGERLTSLAIGDDLLAQEAALCRQEIESVRNAPWGSLGKFALMGLHQAWRYRRTQVPVAAAASSAAVADVKAFLDAHATPSQALVVVVGDIDAADVQRHAAKHLGAIPRRDPPAPTWPRAVSGGDVVSDLGATVVALVGRDVPPALADRLGLAMFGGYLSERLAADAALQEMSRSHLTSSAVYPVNDFPFFVLAEARPGAAPEALAAHLESALAAAVTSMDAATYERVRHAFLVFLQSSLLTSPQPMRGVSHDMVLGQEALNIGMREVLRDMRPEDLVVDDLGKRDHAWMKELLARTLAPSARVRYVLRDGGAPVGVAR